MEQLADYAGTILTACRINGRPCPAPTLPEGREANEFKYI